jgi:hypothetical protein
MVVYCSTTLLLQSSTTVSEEGGNGVVVVVVARLLYRIGSASTDPHYPLLPRLSLRIEQLQRLRAVRPRCGVFTVCTHGSAVNGIAVHGTAVVKTVAMIFLSTKDIPCQILSYAI